MEEGGDLERLGVHREANRTIVGRILAATKTIMDDVRMPRDQKVNGLRIQLELLYKRTETLQKIDEEIQHATPVNQLAQEILDAERYSTDLFERRVRVEDYFENLRPPNARADDAGTAHSHTHRSIRLPKLNLPKFDGKSLFNWSPFWDTYEVEIHGDADLADVTKFNYLRGQLSGEALQTISGLAVTGTNYPKAVELLQERYGKPEKIVAAHFRAIHNMQPASDSLTSLRSFYDTLESHIRSLEGLGKDTESYGAPVVCTLLDKIPGNVRRELARVNGTEEWTLDELRTALQTEIAVMEAGQVQPRPFQSSREESGSCAVLNNISSRPGGPKNCLFCDESQATVTRR